MSDARRWAGRRLHLLGIGGAGMSGYAAVAVALGATVSGSDGNDGPVLEQLRGLGVAVHVGHDAANVPDGADVEVIYSSAIPQTNPERAAAQDRGLRVAPRAELLGELSALKRTIAVAGAHGKTTTSSMVAHILLGCGIDPAYLIGGDLRSTGRNAAWGAGDWLVVEADESDRSMLSLHVDVAVVTNVELDHHATYGSLAEVQDVFRELLDGPPHAVLPADDAGVLVLRGAAPVTPFAVAELQLDPLGSRFSWRGHEVRVAVPGAHNARNAAAALEAAALAGADPAAAITALAGFTGARRRFELLGEGPHGVPVFDDYAHHPTEVAATLAAARTLGAGRVVAVFQPHLFSRTQHLAGGFGRALAAADVVALLDVYPARERAQDFPGVSGLTIAEAVADAAPGREVLWVPGFDAAEQVLRARLRAGDVCLVMGAGDVRRLGERLAGA